MKICCRKAHTKACYGAVGSLDEYVESRKLFPKVIELLKPYHTIIDVTPADSNGYGEWNIGVNSTNSHNPDLFFSLHFNSSSGDPRGTEVCVHSTDSVGANYGSRICSNMSKLGFTNRGVKKRNDLAETTNIKAPSIIIEVCFVQASDAALYRKVGIDKIARAIANAIDSRVSLNGSISTVPANGNSEKLERSYPETGVATVIVDTLNVRNVPSTENNNPVATYYRNEKINYDSVYVTNKYYYISYISGSGVRRYVASRSRITSEKYLYCV